MNTLGKIVAAFLIAFAITLFISWKYYGHDVATLSYFILLFNCILSYRRLKRDGAQFDLKLEIVQIFAVPIVLSINWLIDWLVGV